MADVMIHEFLLGFIKIYILQYAEKEPVYGKEIHDQLKSTAIRYHLVRCITHFTVSRKKDT